MKQNSIKRVLATHVAEELIEQLVAEHGPLLFHQSGGCCDGSAPMCYRRDEFRLSPHDVCLGEINEQPFYIGGQQFNLWKHTQLVIDVVPGRGAGFSIESPRCVRFITRSRVFTEDEMVALEGLRNGVEH